MSYLELKLIKGNLYGYIRQSIRIGKRVIHPNIAYLGRMDGVERASAQPIEYTPRKSEQEPQGEPNITKEIFAQIPDEEEEEEPKTKEPKELKTKGLNLKTVFSSRIPGEPQGTGKEDKQILIHKKTKKKLKKKTVNGYTLKDYLL